MFSNFGNGLPSGASYFANIGPTWDVALSAIEADTTAHVIQRPRIQTSQAKPAQFFVGKTVPYITGTYYSGSYGNSGNSYSQLSVGVELDVTPFINPDGLVVMDINQEIDDVSGFTTIDGNQVPNTDKRTLSSEIAVRDRDTIMLGGFVRTDSSRSKTGVPFLQDIPLLGNLFTQRNDKKDRQELVVLMRPTVLKTPDDVALQTLREEQRLPGVSEAAAAEAADERKLIDAQRKKELRRQKSSSYNDGFYTMPPATNSPAPQAPNQSSFYNPPAAAPAVQNYAPAPAAKAPATAAPVAPVVPVKPAQRSNDDGFFYNDTPAK